MSLVDLLFTLFLDLSTKSCTRQKDGFIAYATEGPDVMKILDVRIEFFMFALREFRKMRMMLVMCRVRCKQTEYITDCYRGVVTVCIITVSLMSNVNNT